MTENDDGTAERLRRDWIADALQEHAMCPDGYVVDTRHYVPDANGPFGNGGEILYTGTLPARTRAGPAARGGAAGRAGIRRAANPSSTGAAGRPAR